MHTVIFGAQGIALSVYEAFTISNPEEKVECFLVTSHENNPSSLAELPVRALEDYSNECADKSDVQILVATPANVMGEIGESLHAAGFCNITLMKDEELNNLCTEASRRGIGYASVYDGNAGNELPTINVYMACSKFDKPLIRKYDIPEYMIPIHVGADSHDNMNAKLFDNTGINISHKNGNYCELTGLYWVWKNVLNEAGDESSYYGLCQYRRFLDLAEEDLRRIKANDIDVVLPFPLTYEPDIEEHRKRYIKNEDGEALLRVLEELHPEQMPEVKTILQQKWLFNYNVILAKKSVLKEYCEWLFPILEKVEEYSNPKGNQRSDRYIGYMGETLETIYFMLNKDRYKVVHGGCRLLV
ncbi:DUF4422 domain-containing protein [Pseudobutyrivibrio xylanivorans]|uniref:DUF4422 domain-containing protein n=1 Tax=Pseudobutyrivibrio xylanivorans TaxID=185007 RepID=A0A1G5RS71_PSEXY|nr:DUF4422 domain-containing protein [Pseudobutyrivibrio xylanivorans]SCZ76109.1 protein of unknown function [Pseudobutyrivibrio xylanivorans]